MKYIDEKRLRAAYLVVFALGVTLAVVAYWDTAYNAQANTPLIMAGMVALLAIALLFYLATELILRDAVQLEPVGVATAERAALHVPPEVSGPTGDRRPRESLPRPVPTPAPIAPLAPTPTPMFASPPIAVSPVDLLLARPSPEPLLVFEEEPAALPKPPAVPLVVSPAREETLSLEVGDPYAARGESVRRRKPRRVGPVESVRVLCGACGLYFSFQTDPGRPQEVPCPRCEKALVVSGHQRAEPHLRLRCRACGDTLHMPKLHDVSAVQCATCGQANEIRSLASGPAAEQREVN